MELQELRIFKSIIEGGSFKNAASSMGVTQPAVSQSLANLERKLGTKLIERTTPVNPTPIGVELLKHAQYVLSSELEFKDQIKRLKNGHLVSLSIACDHIMSKYYCPKLIQKFHNKYPDAQLKVHKMPPREIIQNISNKHIDIGIGPFQKHMRGFQHISLLNKESILVAGKKNQSIGIYNKDPLKFLSKNILLASYLDSPEERPSRKKIRDYFKSVWEINDMSLQLELVSNGLGVTFITKEFLDSDPIKKDLKVLDKLPFSLIKKEYGLYFLNQNSNEYKFQLFLDAIK